MLPGFPFCILPRKEVIQPHLPIRLPWYDFTPVIGLTFGAWLLSVTSATSGATNSHGVTGGVYKARERIHRGMLADEASAGGAERCGGAVRHLLYALC